MAKKEEDAQIMQQKYMEMQMLDQQLKQVQQQLHAVEQQSMEVESVIDALGNISKVEPGSDILVPLSSGIFIKAKIQDNKELLVNVGGNTTVNKSVPEVQEMLKKQVAELEKVKKDLTEHFTKFADKMQTLQAELMKGE
ncbi:prefoldin subunit alpha [Candidatus Woesearchaeota archaeon]|nr:prefoldin subunit alpha [Candidatus Woesearchaeota archaeon]MBW3005744.1 prefoldin subunit alpha [Candidatus Woesearchaeota archaeon]